MVFSSGFPSLILGFRATGHGTLHLPAYLIAFSLDLFELCLLCLPVINNAFVVSCYSYRTCLRARVRIVLLSLKARHMEFHLKA